MELYQFIIIVILLLLNLFRNFLKNYFSEKGKNFATREDIEEITEKIESVKKEIALKINEHQIKFSYLHNERAKVIIELYAKLSRMELNLIYFINPVQSAGRDYNEDLKKCSSLITEFIFYYNETKIFFTKEIKEILDNIIQKIRDAWFNYTLDPPIKTEYMSKDIYKDNFERWNEAWKSIDKVIPELKERLENELKNILEP
jgi:hypothetical protein